MIPQGAPVKSREELDREKAEKAAKVWGNPVSRSVAYSAYLAGLAEGRAESQGEIGCEAGCVAFSGGERRHNEHCRHYPGSQSELVVKLKSQLAEEQRLNGMGSEKEARLMARVAELEKKVHLWQERANKNGNRAVYSQDEVDDFRAQLAASQEESKRYREALEFYADKFSWRTNSGKIGVTPLTSGEDAELIDGHWTGGKRARAALAKLEAYLGDKP